MAASNLNLGKASGGVLNIQPADGTTNTSLVLPASGTVVATDVAVTDNAIARFDGTTGKLQNSGVIVDDSGNLTTDATLKATKVSAATGSDFVTIGGWDNVNHRVEYVNRPLKITGYGTNSDIIFANNNDSEKMRIDSAGRVTMPYQPAFSATAPVNTFTPPSNVYTGYTRAITNVGNYYNTSNSRFTAPVAGVYYFWHQASARTVSSATYEIKIYKNTSTELSRVFNNGAGYGHGGIATAIVYLNAGDYVEAGFYNGPGVVLSGGDDIGNNTPGVVTGWGGYLIG